MIWTNKAATSSLADLLRTYCWSFIDDILMVSETTRGSTTVSRTRTGVEEKVLGRLYMFSLFLLVLDYEYFNVEFTSKQKNLVFMPVDSYRKNQWNLSGYGYRHESHIFLNCEDQNFKI